MDASWRATRSPASRSSTRATPRPSAARGTELADDVALVLLTAEARRSLPDPLLPRDLLWAVLPE